MKHKVSQKIKCKNKNQRNSAKTSAQLCEKKEIHSLLDEILYNRSFASRINICDFFILFFMKLLVTMWLNIGLFYIEFWY